MLEALSIYKRVKHETAVPGESESQKPHMLSATDCIADKRGPVPLPLADKSAHVYELTASLPRPQPNVYAAMRLRSVAWRQMLVLTTPSRAGGTPAVTE